MATPVPEAGRVQRWSSFQILNLLAVLVILVLDALTPAGVVVGILLCVPIILTSITDDRRHVWFVSAFATAGFVLAAVFGHGPIAPSSVWIPNRVLGFLTLPASCGIALMLQRRRLEAHRVRDEAIRARDLTRLLMSLLAHDLRSPLGMAVMACEYVRGARAEGQPPDEQLLSDVQARLQRSLRKIDSLLSLTRGKFGGNEPPAERPQPVDLIREIEAEVDAFSAEATVRGKLLVTDLSGVQPAECYVDGLVLRQALSILIDNAVRHAIPGSVRVSAANTSRDVVVRVEDQGPGLSARTSASNEGTGSGLGLELCRALVWRAEGALETVRDGPDGTTLELRLPLLRGAKAPPPPGATSDAGVVRR